MTDGLEERGRALEEGYFRQKDNELIGKMRRRINAEPGTNAYNCPKCAGKLLTGNFENVQIDVCDSCGGVWLDAGELEQIVRKPDDQSFFGRLFG